MNKFNLTSTYLTTTYKSGLSELLNNLLKISPPKQPTSEEINYNFLKAIKIFRDLYNQDIISKESEMAIIKKLIAMFVKSNIYSTIDSTKEYAFE